MLLFFHFLMRKITLDSLFAFYLVNQMLKLQPFQRQSHKMIKCDELFECV